MHYRCYYRSPIGALTIASDGEYITGLWIEGQKFFLENHSNPIDLPDLPIFQETIRWLDAYFSGQKPQCSALPLKPAGTKFQQQVWQILTRIPYGQTVTYGQIAKMLGIPRAAQAVGGAVGHNPVSIIIPCHRVVGADGRLTGYAAGLDKKGLLLRHEGIIPSGKC